MINNTIQIELGIIYRFRQLLKDLEKYPRAIKGKYHKFDMIFDFMNISYFIKHVSNFNKMEIILCIDPIPPQE